MYYKPIRAPRRKAPMQPRIISNHHIYLPALLEEFGPHLSDSLWHTTLPQHRRNVMGTELRNGHNRKLTRNGPRTNLSDKRLSPDMEHGRRKIIGRLIICVTQPHDLQVYISWSCRHLEAYITSWFTTHSAFSDAFFINSSLVMTVPLVSESHRLNFVSSSDCQSVSESVSRSDVWRTFLWHSLRGLKRVMIGEFVDKNSPLWQQCPC
jgi:hypothetical protein